MYEKGKPNKTGYLALSHLFLYRRIWLFSKAVCAKEEDILQIWRGMMGSE